MLAESLFWVSLLGVFYAYVGYPLLLAVLGVFARQTVDVSGRDYYPTLTLIIPVHNEERVIEGKLRNLESLRYPRERFSVLIVSDGSTDDTKQHVLAYRGDLRIQLLELEERQGKAAALNRGLELATGEIVVFTDASIFLDADALSHIARPFQDPTVGCVSGEDHIPAGGGEGLYGRYELFLRNLESKWSSIAGASGSFYAIRSKLCTPFLAGMAPDFLSVLSVVEQRYRAITEPRARGTMSSTKSARGEFQRKVRTLIRGMTALWHARGLLNPIRSGSFALVLWSHKLARWLVPLFLAGLLGANLWLLDDAGYLLLFVAQLLFYGTAGLALIGVPFVRSHLIGKVALYFTVVNAAILVAWARFLSGVRQEIWEPTRR